MTDLFEPYQIKGISIKNRIVLPPLVRFGWGDETGLVSQRHLAHYESIARAGAGLIIVEATCVSREGRLSDDQLGLWDDEQVAGMRELAQRCKQHGAVALVQIHHAGFRRTRGSVADLSAADLQGLKDAFWRGAERAKSAGFDGIELHGAHGYLISQFTSPVTNKRQDRYGGDLAGRSRFAVELVQHLSPLADDHFVLGYRMGANAPTLEDGFRLAQMLEEAGVELLHVSNNGADMGEIPELPADFAYHWIVYAGSQVRQHVGVPVIVVMGIRTPAQAREILAAGLADFVAVGRGQLADPEWALKAAQGLEPDACRECKRCAWHTNGDNCVARLAAASHAASS